MNAEQKSETAALVSPPPPSAEAPHARPTTPWTLVLVAIALLGVLVLGWLAWQSNQRFETTRQELARRLADNEGAQREALTHAKQHREALDAMHGKVGAFEAQLAEMQSQQMALQAMYQELSRVREDRLLAEIEQDVAIAAQQLQLAGNVEAALIALQGAEARLARNAQPQFLPLRKLLVRDIERLKALPGADVSGIALKLDTLLAAVPNLPLAFEQRPAVPPKPKKGAPAPSATNTAKETASAVPPAPGFEHMVRTWLGEIWHEMRQLVRIERIDRPDPGLLAPREAYFLRENLRLRLLSARLALLARDGRSFQNDLKQAEEWLGQYFDTRAAAVIDAQTSLKTLLRLDVMREPAELNETLSALRNFKLARDKR
jgi:uroporphyrin-3 C-methyltransferase